MFKWKILPSSHKSCTTMLLEEKHPGNNGNRPSKIAVFIQIFAPMDLQINANEGSQTIALDVWINENYISQTRSIRIMR